MNNDQYQPISCSDYDVYEIAIMRQQLLELVWWDGAAGRCSARVKPVGLKIRDGAEFLLIRPQPPREDLLEIRLDRIISSNITGP